jgi:hypothetical protein
MGEGEVEIQLHPVAPRNRCVMIEAMLFAVFLNRMLYRIWGKHLSKTGMLFAILSIFYALLLARTVGAEGCL